MYVQDTGRKDAPAIVFLHGGGVGGWMWARQVAALQEFHCLVPDMPEQGQSLDDKPFTIRDTADKIAALIRTHGGKAHVVGLSLGAQVAVQMLASAPDVIDHAIISSALVRPIPGASTVRWMVWGYMPFRNIDFLVRANAKAYSIPDSDLPSFREETRRMTLDSFTHYTAENMSFRLPAGLDRVTAPVLVVTGEREYGIMRNSAHDLAAVLPNAKQVVAKGVSHNWSFEAPDDFTQMIRAWITDQPLPERLQPVTG